MSGPFHRHKLYLSQHRAHDYAALIKRWETVAKTAGLRLQVLCEADKYPVYFLEHWTSADVERSKEPLKKKKVRVHTKRKSGTDSRRSFYLSAGIHGDEPASTEGLIHWAENHLVEFAKSQKFGFLIFPCLNPWGLVQNSRGNAAGIDLNRSFDQDNLAPISEMKDLVKGRRFDRAITLHEDYDAQGIYLYELSSHKSLDIGEKMLSAMSDVIPLEPRKSIEGLRARKAIVRQRIGLERIPIAAESIHLFGRHTASAITVETPSEFCLAHRIEAHRRGLVEWLG